MQFPRSLCLAIGLLASSLASAGNDTVYYPDQGKLIIPNLKMGSQTYFVILKQLPNSYDFRLDSPSITPLSVPLTFTPAAAADLVGTFSPADDLGTSVTFKADGTYSMFQGAGDPECKSGAESGTYQYDPTTGVLTAVATADANGDCGLSHSSGIARVKKVSGELYLMSKENNQVMEFKLVKR